MQFSTLVSIATVLATLPVSVFGTGYESGTTCATLTSTSDCHGAYSTCTVLACLEIKPITQSCGCTTIPTTTVCQTACPTSCGATSYITAIEDCFPTHTPPPTTTPPPPYSTPTPTPPTVYPNTTRTETKTHITTLTTCPASVTCTGQTTTYTSTEVCPTTTCTCVLPSVTFPTTALPVPTGNRTTTSTTLTTGPGNTPPSPPATPSATPAPTFIEVNLAGKWGVSVGTGLVGAFVIAFLGMM